MDFRLNPDRFNCFSDLERAEKIERHITISKNKFFRSNVFKTKAQALFEEIEGYYARNKEYHSEFCDFNTYIKHWTEAHRGIIQDIYLDAIEENFGKLEGPLYILRNTASWCTKKNWRNTPIPDRGNNEKHI